MFTNRVLLAALLMTSGCASIHHNARVRQAMRVEAREQGVTVGLDVTALEAIREDPLGTLGAALLDAGTAWAIYEVGDWLDGELNDDGGSASSPARPAILARDKSTVTIRDAPQDSGLPDYDITVRDQSAVVIDYQAAEEAP